MDEKYNLTDLKHRLEHFARITDDKSRESRMIVKSLKARKDAKRSSSEVVADWITAAFGSINFLVINVVLFTVWIIANLNLIPSVKPFDPFPFGLLTMAVSLEAIILAVFVLISQNREGRVSDLREEIDIQVDLVTEQELTKLMEIVAKIADKNGIDLSKDEQLQKMLRPFPAEKIEHDLEEQVAA